MNEEGLEEFGKKLKGLVHNTHQLILKNKLKNEEDVKSAVIDPLLKLLGWNVSNLDQVSKEHPIEGGSIDYALLHNGKVKAIIEAKAHGKSLDGYDQTKSKGKRTYVEQAINYAYNHPDGVNWALLTNGAEWRLYNAYFKGSIEKKLVFKLPLDKLVENSNKIALLSRESIESGLTDKKFRNRPLRKPVDVEIVEFLLIARDKLTTSIRNKNKDKYDIETLRIGIQRILDRLLFFKICEDRDILEFGRLRDFFQLYTEKMLSKDSFVPGLKNFFRDFDNVYNGDMFAAHPCEDFSVENKVYEFIINGLYEYDFATINVDILGRIYENYLGNTLQSLEKGLTWTPDPRERKKFGQYYTPQYVVDYIVENVGITKDSNVLDPACGSGAFLIKAYDNLKREYEKYNEAQLKNSQKGKIDTNLSMVEDVPNEILTKNLYGVDLNPEAVEISKINLWLRSIRKDVRLSNLDHNIEVGNSLISGSEDELKEYFENPLEKRPFNWEERFSEVFKEDGFDAVIGNPPYVSTSMIEMSDRTFFRKTFTTSGKEMNTFSLFMEQGYTLLKNKGLLGFIIPDSFLYVLSYWKLREFILENFSIKSIVVIPGGAFEDATVGNSVILIIQKEDNDTLRDENIVDTFRLDHFDGKFTNLDKVQQRLYHKTPENIFYCTNAIIYFLLKMKNNCFLLGEITELKDGVKTGNNKKFTSDRKESKQYKKVLIGSDIFTYSLEYNNRYLNYDRQLLAGARQERIFLAEEKIILRQTGDRIIATYDNEQYYTLDNTHLILQDNPKFNLKYILCLINSRLINYYYSLLVPETDRTYAQVRMVNLEKLPIKDVSQNVQTKCANLVDRMLELHKQLSSINTDFSRYLSFRPLLNNSKFVTYFNSLSPSDKIVLNKANMTKATVKKIRVTEDGEWLTFKVDAVTTGQTPFENVEALKCRFTDTKLRKFLFYILKDLKGTNGKGVIIEKILNLPVPKFSPDPKENREAIDNLMDEFLPAVAEKERLEKEIEETDKTIDLMVYKLYNLTDEEIKVVEGDS